MSWVQFNLLPDSKLEFNRTQRTKKLVFTIAIVACSASVAIFLVMLGLVDGVQKKLMDDAAVRVDESSKQLQTLNIGKMITIQNQLNALPSLHQKKHITSRIFGYLPKITPSNVSINKLDLDFTKNTMTLSGTASSQKDVNTLIDTLKFTTFKIGSSNSARAFKNVVESGFNITGKDVGYTVDMEIDPKLFSNDKDDQGKPVAPVITVDKSLFNAPLKNQPSSNQTSTGGR
ncbi:PilN domain-containing protein [Candidatus Saccharibacteria bacterium]|nr:PilN domain-containing protein [Candidatus Saccharibacteria bacterium]